MQSTGGKEQHSAAVQLGKGVRDTIQVVQGPLPVLNILYIYILLLYILYIIYIYICYVCVCVCVQLQVQDVKFPDSTVSRHDSA